MAEMKTFNKLVRDKIPEILAEKSCAPEIEVLSETDYLRLLNEKLIEEAREVICAESKIDKIEEIADVLEVLYAIMKNLGISREKIEEVRKEKVEKRGGFDNKILLKRAFLAEFLN